MTGARVVSALVLSTAVLVAGQAPAATVTLGELTISYDPARFEVVDVPQTAPAAKVYRFTCREPDCRNLPTITAASQPAAAPNAKPCLARTARGELLGGFLGGDGVVVQQAANLEIYRWIQVSGCRARTPLHRAACAEIGGNVYTFDTGANFGCSGIEGAPEPVFEAFLAGIALRPSNVP